MVNYIIGSYMLYREHNNEALRKFDITLAM